jgi:hypothetical protein
MTTWTIFPGCPPVGGWVAAGPPADAVGDGVLTGSDDVDAGAEADESGEALLEHPTSADTAMRPTTNPYRRTRPSVMWRIGRVFPHLL